MPKEVVEVIGTCSSARYVRALIDSVGTSLRGQDYWNLKNPDGVLIAENKQSMVTKDYGHEPTMADSIDFVNVVLLGHLNVQHIEFTGDPIA